MPIAALQDLVSQWGLVPDGPVQPGPEGALPVRTADGEAAWLLLLAAGPQDVRLEALALQQWAGAGAVRLLRADPRRGALLVERTHEHGLLDAWDLEACEVIAGLYGRLHRPATPQLPLLTDCVARLVEPLAGLPRDAAVPHRLVEQAVALARDLVVDRHSSGVLVHGDLHYARVRAAEREPWLATRPRPLSGDPHWEPAPLLWHRWQELLDGGDVRDAVRRRFHTVVDAAGLDEDRARDWVVVRAVLAAHEVVTGALDAGRRPDRAERARLTRLVTVAKAVQD